MNDKGEKKKNDTKELGSTLMDTMLKEVSDFCDPFIREDWALKPHHQVCCVCVCVVWCGVCVCGVCVGGGLLGMHRFEQYTCNKLLPKTETLYSTYSQFSFRSVVFLLFHSMSLLPCVAYLRLQGWWWHYRANVPASRPDLQG